MLADYEKLGAFYLGRRYDLEAGEGVEEPLLYDSRDLVTHAFCVGMTGSGKTGLCVGLLEEAAIDGVPALAIDPKGDLGNLLLTFPELRPSDFRPWVNEDDARRKGLTLDEHAAGQAELWRGGLAAWGQDGERIRRLRESADFTIYTPGSEAGRPISVLASFKAPPAAVAADADLFRDRVATTATSVLGLLGVDADPIRSREHILLSSLLDHFWKEGKDVDLGRLIHAIQAPPLERVGVLDLETFYPSKERFELAMLLNNLLAAPGFETWLKGEALDVERLLYTPEGKPRVAVLSIAHLSEAERMFFVSLLLNEVLGWIRTRPGTTSLRAILYMDEIFGFLPPVAEPPSKRPLLTLLKQARAYGLGVVLATQNPVDLDYKGLSNTGTWFIGRLQTERDKARLLDGLEGAMDGQSLDRAALDRTLSGLGKRVFLLHNVHEKEGPVPFETRWVMSYLRGPLTRLQIQSLMADKKAPAVPPPAAEAAPATKATGAVPPPPAVPGVASRPMVDPGVPQAFLRPASVSGPGGPVYQPCLLGLGRVQFVDRRTKETVAVEEPALLLELVEEMSNIDWAEAGATTIDDRDLLRAPAADGSWLPLPNKAGQPRSYTSWKNSFSDHLYRTSKFEILHSAARGEDAAPGESERAFRIRLGELWREARDDRVEELRERTESQREKLDEKIRKARQKVEKEREQASREKMNTVINAGAAVLQFLTGRKRLSQTTLSKAGTALRGAGRSREQAGDVERAEETVEALVEEIRGLEAELNEQIAAVREEYDPLTDPLESKMIRPRRADVDVRLVTLLWTA